MPIWIKILALSVAAALMVMALLLFISTRQRGRRGSGGVFSRKTRDRFVRTRTRRGGRS